MKFLEIILESHPPFGMLMPERNYNNGNYRFGYNGKEKDDEIKSSGNSLDFGSRIYDSRLGRWLSIDPLGRKYPSISPFTSFANNPIYFTDPDGRIIKPANADAVQLINQMFSSFDTKINGQSASGKDLFGISSKADETGLYKTVGTLNEFTALLNNTTLTKDQKKEATAIFKVLAASDIVEIGIVDVSTTMAKDPIATPGDNSTVVLITENSLAESLIDASVRGTKSNIDIRGELLKQETSGVVGENEAFGYYDNNNNVAPVGGVKGIILVNADGSINGDFTYSTEKSDPKKDKKDVAAIKKSILKFSKSKVFTEEYTK